MKVKTSTDSAASAGRTSGSTTFQKICHSLAPSMRAASISSCGRSRMKLRMKKVQKPVWKAMWNSTSPPTESYSPRRRLRSRTGTIRICNGMKLPPTNRKNTARFALKR